MIMISSPTFKPLAFVLLFVFSVQLTAQSDDFDFDIGEEEESFTWQTPAGNYNDPNSFFSLHGYVNGVFAGQSEDWLALDPTQLGAPGQLLVPNTDNSAFQFDFALIIGSEMTERTRILVETHYVSDPSGQGAAGPGGATIAITEATGSYDLFPKYMTISGGLFWSPFGIVNRDWLGAQNNFALLPRAMGAYPVHFNERGVRVNGVFQLSETAAINYVASIGNGVSNYNISGQSAYDNNNNKTVTGRIGIFPGLGKNLDVGFSYMTGQLRNDVNEGLLFTDVERYKASTSAIGADFTFTKSNIEFKGYYIRSNETLEEDSFGNNPDDIGRMGFTCELNYLFRIENEYFLGIKPRVRYDHLELTVLGSDGPNLDSSLYESNTVAFGVDFMINDNFRFSFDHNLTTEIGQPELANNRYIGKIIAQF